jgi:uncharacterized membrane protein
MLLNNYSIRRFWRINLKSIAVAIITLLAFGISGFPQITVSTITPQFKGCGGLSQDAAGNL